MIGLLYSELCRRWRTFYWHVVLLHCGKNFRVNGRVYMSLPEKVEIGNDVSINDGVVISGLELIVIEDFVRISPHVCISSSGLDINQHYSKRTHVSAPIKICKGAWLGIGCIILPGVTIGEGAVVGAGAVVTHDVEPFTVVVGVPAKEIKKVKP